MGFPRPFALQLAGTLPPPGTTQPPATQPSPPAPVTRTPIPAPKPAPNIVPGVEVGAGPTWSSFANKNDDPHFGYRLNVLLTPHRLSLLEGKLDIDPQVLISYADVSRNLGEDVYSKGSQLTLAAGATFNWNFNSWFRSLIGVYGGGTGTFSKASGDGVSGGGLVSANLGVKSSWDYWYLTLGFRAGVGIREQWIGKYIAIGGNVSYQFGWTAYPNYVPDFAAKSQRGFGVENLSHSLMFTVPVRFHLGRTYQAINTPNEDDQKSKLEEERKKKEIQEARPAIAFSEHVKELKNNLAQLLAGEVTSNVTQTNNSLQTARDTSKPHNVRREAAEDARQIYRSLSKRYEEFVEKALQAEDGLNSIQALKIATPYQEAAKKVVEELKAETQKLQAKAHEAWENVSNAVQVYNQIRGVPRGGRLEFEDPDPQTDIHIWRHMTACNEITLKSHEVLRTKYAEQIQKNILILNLRQSTSVQRKNAVNTATETYQKFKATLVTLLAQEKKAKEYLSLLDNSPVTDTSKELGKERTKRIEALVAKVKTEAHKAWNNTKKAVEAYNKDQPQIVQIQFEEADPASL
jgi:hypothetical protein